VSYWIVDYISNEVLKRRQRYLGHKMRNAPFKFQPGDWFAFFEAHGWRSKEMRYLAAEAERVRRPFPLPRLAMLVWGLRGLFMSRARRDAYKKFAGYALLEPA